MAPILNTKYLQYHGRHILTIYLHLLVIYGYLQFGHTSDTGPTSVPPIQVCMEGTPIADKCYSTSDPIGYICPENYQKDEKSISCLMVQVSKKTPICWRPEQQLKGTYCVTQHYGEITYTCTKGKLNKDGKCEYIVSHVSKPKCPKDFILLGGQCIKKVYYNCHEKEYPYHDNEDFTQSKYIKLKDSQKVIDLVFQQSLGEEESSSSNKTQLNLPEFYDFLPPMPYTAQSISDNSTYSHNSHSHMDNSMYQDGETSVQKRRSITECYQEEFAPIDWNCDADFKFERKMGQCVRRVYYDKTATCAGIVEGNACVFQEKEAASFICPLHSQHSQHHQTMMRNLRTKTLNRIRRVPLLGVRVPIANMVNAVNMSKETNDPISDLKRILQHDEIKTNDATNMTNVDHEFVIIDQLSKSLPHHIMVEIERLNDLQALNKALEKEGYCYIRHTVPIVAQCEEGYQANGRICYKELEPHYTCPVGYKLDDSLCKRD